MTTMTTDQAEILRLRSCLVRIRSEMWRYTQDWGTPGEFDMYDFIDAALEGNDY